MCKHQDVVWDTFCRCPQPRGKGCLTAQTSMMDCTWWKSQQATALTDPGALVWEMTQGRPSAAPGAACSESTLLGAYLQPLPSL